MSWGRLHPGRLFDLGLFYRQYKIHLSISMLLINPLNATGANTHQITMLIENYGIERVIYIQIDRQTDRQTDKQKQT